MWVWVSLRYATFGLRVSRGGLIVEAPPIAYWTLGRDWDTVHSYYQRRGADIRRLGDCRGTQDV